MNTLGRTKVALRGRITILVSAGNDRDALWATRPTVRREPLDPAHPARSLEGPSLTIRRMSDPELDRLVDWIMRMDRPETSDQLLSPSLPAHRLIRHPHWQVARECG